MVYKNPNGGSRDMAMYIAYVLNKDFGRTHNDIRQNFVGENSKPVAQSTVSNWIRDVSHQVEVKNLQRELDAARQYIAEVESRDTTIGSISEPILLPAK
jgi:hypothetical protein